MNSWKKVGLLFIVTMMVICCCFSGLLVIIFFRTGINDTTSEIIIPTITMPTATLEGSQQLSESGAYETLRTMQEEVVPINDPRDLARRLEGKSNIPLTIEAPLMSLSIGDQQEFWATNVDTNESFRIIATLRYETAHVYFWIENGIDFSAEHLRQLAETFEYQIYPTNREFFGSEWKPGIDNDPHIYIMLSRGLGFGLAGYFSSVDSVHPLAHEYSNAHEMFFLNADNISLDEEFTYGVLAHEFQHMIHWYRDRNESTWLNEGFSELAAYLNGYNPGGFDYLYISDPDLQLNDWPNDSNATTPHYGAAFLFVTYFLDRFGEEATKALVAHPENGMDSIDEVLGGMGIKDAKSGKLICADDVVSDWVIATLLNDESIGDGRYSYRNYPDAPEAVETEWIVDCNAQWEERMVNQYGVDYIRISCPEMCTLDFEGSSEVSVLPIDAYSGLYAFWSNKGDESDMTLTRMFDFSGVSEPITFSYMIWYDLEEDYDYLYLLASEDGENWQILTTPSGTANDPSGNSYGWGYNGYSDGWIQERVDLSRFAGEKIQFRFEYITDAAVNGEGLLLDDLSISEISYSTDFEDDNGGWEPEGFVRIQNRLPQTYRVSLIRLGDNIEVESRSVTADEILSFPLNVEGGESDYILTVTGTTRYTRQPAVYRFRLRP